MPDIKRVLGWALIPCSAMLPALLLLPLPHFGEGGFDAETYLRYREFVGGNPSEVYSHFLDLVLLTGNVLASALNVGGEALYRELHLGNSPKGWATCWYWLGLICSGVLAVALEAEHGEGTTFIVFWFGFLPVLFASHWLLRALASNSGWRVGTAFKWGGACVGAHASLQALYEPSVTGAPNFWFVPLWLASLGANIAIAVYLLRQRLRPG